MISEELIRKAIQSLRIESVEVVADAGEHIEAVQSRACQTALVFRCRVTFRFNGDTHHVDYRDLLSMVIKQAPAGPFSGEPDRLPVPGEDS